MARENQTSFEEYLSNNSHANPGIDLTVTVLTTGFWPSYKSFDLNLPPELVIWNSIWYKFAMLIYFVEVANILLFFCYCFRSSVLKFSGNSIKQKQSTENLHGYTLWVLVISVGNLNPKLWNWLWPLIRWYVHKILFLSYKCFYVDVSATSEWFYFLII